MEERVKDLEFEYVHVKRDIQDIRETMAQQNAERKAKDERWYEVTDDLKAKMDKFLSTFTIIKWCLITALTLLTALNLEDLGLILKTILKIAV